MPYRHPAARIHEIVQAPQVLAAGQSVEPNMHDGDAIDEDVENCLTSTPDQRLVAPAGI